MKRKLFLFATLLSVSLFSISCEDSSVEDDVQSEVTPESGYAEDLSYSPELVAVNPGYERGEFSINLNSDGRTIQSYLLYWDNGKSVKEVSVSSTSDNITEILDMAEGDYTFYIKARDSKDMISAASEKVSVYIYGETLASSLPGRIVESGSFDNKKTFTLAWAEDTYGVTKTEVTYTPYLGVETTVECDAEATTIDLPNAVEDEEITIKSYYLPYTNALDELTVTSTTIIGDSRTFVTVSSIEDMQAYLTGSNQNIKLLPGTYTVTATTVATGIYNTTATDLLESTCSFIYIQGSNNYFDFNGVEIFVETGAFNAHGTGNAFNHIRFIGNNNTIKGLSMTDVGDVEDYPVSGCTNIVMDGEFNHLEDIYVYSTGSYPYGYGSLFGIGSPFTIKHYKHCMCLVRGNDNSVKNSTFINRAFGHSIFMQGAVNVDIEGCYVEGEMGNTNDVLAEYGTGSAADLVNFVTYWYDPVPADYTMALSEDAIRAYASGTTYINGEEFSGRNTSGNINIIDCTVKHGRGGIVLCYGSQTSYVENCTLIGCQYGFSMNSNGRIVNSSADGALGHALTFSDGYSNLTADITILPYNDEPYSGNGSGQAVFIRGSGHDITFRKGEGLDVENSTYKDYSITVGGDTQQMGKYATTENYSASKSTIVNETGIHMYIDDNASNMTISTNGTYEDYGSSNTITEL